MKISFKTLIAATTCFVITSAGSALTISDATFRDVDFPRSTLNSNSPSASGVFDITNAEDGWRDKATSELGNYSIVDAIVGFVFLDTSADSGPIIQRAEFGIGDYFRREVSADKIPGSGLPDELDPPSTATFQVELDSGTFPTLGSLVLDVQNDGLVDWAVSLSSLDANSPDVSLTLHAVYLGVEAVRNEQVPDSGTTAGMLGLAALGLAASYRHRRLKS